MQKNDFVSRFSFLQKIRRRLSSKLYAERVSEMLLHHTSKMKERIQACKAIVRRLERVLVNGACDDPGSVLST